MNDELTGEYSILNLDGTKSYQAIYKNGIVTTENINKAKELEITENKKCSTK
jgi:hypothetical protein